MNQSQELLLCLLANRLFGAKRPVRLRETDLQPLLREALQQAVLPLAYTQIKNQLSAEQQLVWRKYCNSYLHKAMMIEYEHAQLERLLADHQIPCAFLKGCASGHYYPDPALRCYGDVDALVRPEDMETVGELLIAKGFVPAVEDDGTIKHVAYHLDSGEIWEIHRFPCDLPTGSAGEVLRRQLSDLLETAVPIATPSGVIHIPDLFHHGLVLLIHTAGHLTSDGIGLRHLCDWAVFVNHVPDFEALFGDVLKQSGLWSFAQLLTQVCEVYLSLPKQSWTGTPAVDLLEPLLEDILNGGNFGNKEKSRHAQVKYIRSYSEGSKVGKQPVVLQMWSNLCTKAKTNHRSIFAEAVAYLRLIQAGERTLDRKEVLDAAAKRKRLYAKLNLFEPQ